MIFTRTFIVAALFATVLAALMTQPAISFANSDQNNVGCSSASTKAYAVTRDGVLRTKDCDKNKTTSSKSWIQDYVISDIGDIETSKFVTTNLEGELKKKYLVVTKEVKNYVLKHKKLDLNKAKIVPGEHQSWTGIPSDNPGSRAFNIFLDGDIEGAFDAINSGQNICAEQNNLKCSWRLELFKSRFLQTLGRGADVESVLYSAGKMEENINGGRLITRASQGSLTLTLGDYELALDELASVAVEIGNWRFPSMRKGPVLAKKLKNRDWMNNLYRMAEATARTHTALAKLFYHKKEYVQALIWGGSAAILMNNIIKFVAGRPDRTTPPPIHAEVFLGIGETYAYMAASSLALEGKKEKPDEMFSVAQSYLVASDAFFGSAIVSAIRAKAFYDANLIEDFLLAADEAVILGSKIGFGELVWQIEALRGQVLLAQGNLDKAEMSLRRAQEAIDLVSGSLSSDRAKLKFGIGKDGVTRLLAEIDAKKGNLTSLYADLERGRARAFVDMIGESLVGGLKDREQTKNIRKLDAKIRQRRLLLSVTGGSTDKLSTQYVSGEDELIAKRADLTAQLRLTNPDLADALSISTIALAEVEAKLLDGDVIVYPMPTVFDRPIKLLLITKTKKEIKKLDISREDLGDLLSDFQFGVILDNPDEQISAALALYAALKIDEWDVKNNVYMVPSSEFYFVAWGALPITHPVIVLPTAGWLARGFVNEVSTGAVIIGDPEFGNTMPQLPGARLEALSVAALYGVEALIGVNATIAAVRERAANGIFLLHLATHGIFDEVNPMHSAVILSDGKQAKPLTAASIFENPIRAGLIVLSACDTGVGRPVSGDDYLGLARSFYIGGAFSVLNSLWPISDSSTKIFMEHFHESAETGRIAKGWLSARDKLRELGATPAEYGAFVLGGAAQVSMHEKK